MSNSIIDWLQLYAENAWLYGGTFLLVLSVLVFVHEWGHYIVARMCGVRVEIFSIGFGKEIFGITDKKGTRWKFSIIPLGGYVKMYGDVDPASAQHLNGVEEKDQDGNEQFRPFSEEERSEAFFAKPVGQRAAVVFAGPAINFLFAIILLAGLYMSYGQPVTPPVAASVIAGTAADEAGFQPHDEIISIDGKPIHRFEQIRRAVMIGLDTERRFTVLRGGEEVEIIAAPQRSIDQDHHGFRHSRGLLGIINPGHGLMLDAIIEIDGVALEDKAAIRAALTERMDTTFPIRLAGGGENDVWIVHPVRDLNQSLIDSEDPDHVILNLSGGVDSALLRHGPVQAVGAAIAETVNITTSTLTALGQMFTGTRSATELGGIIRIGAIAGDMAQAGLIALITFTALLSINLGLINLFPIPMLDGGHLVFYAAEAVRGAPIPDQVQEYAFRLGLVILIGIMLFANLNDIVQLVL